MKKVFNIAVSFHVLLTILLFLMACVSTSSQLQTAVDNYDPATVREIIASGIDPNFILFTDSGAEYTLLQYAAQRLADDIVRVLLDAGADVDDDRLTSQTALFYPIVLEAAFGGYHTTIALLDAGANVNHQTSSGETVLMEAIQWESIDHVMIYIMPVLI